MIVNIPPDDLHSWEQRFQFQDVPGRGAGEPGVCPPGDGWFKTSCKFVDGKEGEKQWEGGRRGEGRRDKGGKKKEGRREEGGKKEGRKYRRISLSFSQLNGWGQIRYRLQVQGTKEVYERTKLLMKETEEQKQKNRYMNGREPEWAIPTRSVGNELKC